MIKILAPAKINLTLEVLSRRPDGYHEIRSIFQTISLYDEMSFVPAKEITLINQGLSIIAEENLVLKAAYLLRQASGKSAGAAITLKKVIPIGAGLGGGSSDAAATLIALNQLWGLGLSREKLSNLAEGVGSDVPYFIYGGTALVGGKGEKVNTLGMAHSALVVLFCPPIPVMANKTQRMYQSIKEADFTDGCYTIRMVEYLRREKRISEDLLFNVFEKTAFSLFPGLDKCKETILNAGSRKVSLAGSGPVLYSIFQEETEAEKLYDKLLQGGNEVYLVKTLN